MKNSLKRKINSVDVVSFDIFDTLILRKVSKPTDVFELVEKKYNRDNIANIFGYTEKRIQAEYNVRKNTKDEEITLDEIYNELHKLDSSLNFNKLKDLEIYIEKKVCFKNSDFNEIISYCREQNKKIIICSDMYLGKEVIKDLLKILDIPYDKLFLSSDLKLKKSTGNIFVNVLKEMKINGDRILHIGDNLKSDILMPRKYSIKTHWYQKKSDFQNKNVYFLNRCIECNLKKESSLKDNYYFNFGYRHLGPLVYGFCKFLNQNLESNQNIIFLAREGKFLMDCFKIYDKKNNNIDYMYVSRKSISSSLVKNFSTFDEMFNSQSLLQYEDVKKFFNRFNLLTPQLEELLLENSINLNSDIRDERVYKFLSENFQSLVIDADKREDVFKAYLELFKLSKDSVIVDIGWNGTMQDLIQQVLDEKNIKINGYYLGVRSAKKNEYKHGFLFDGTNDELEVLSRNMTSFLEILFAADHGSTLGYINLNTPQPILAENDISEEVMVYIKQIQKGALSFVKDFSEDGILDLIPLENQDYFYNLFEFCIHPKMKDIDKFNRFKFWDEKSFDLIGNKQGLKYIFRPKEFIHDYINSGWKNAFMKSIFKLDLPYTLFFKLAYSRRRR